jgi:transposase
MKSIGIDYHKRYSVVCVLDDEGKERVIERIEHAFPERFRQLIEPLGSCQVAFESTMNWGWLHDLLEVIPNVEKIVMANALHVRLISAAQIKTDKVDARKLALLLRANLLPSSHIPNQETRARKEVLRQRTFWVRERTKVRNRIHRMLGRQHGLMMPQVSDLFGKKGREALGKLALASPDDMLLRQQLDTLDVLQGNIKELEKTVIADGKNDPAARWLSTIPGVGHITGNIIAAEIDGISRFGSSKDLVAYAGLIPTTTSSGDKTYHGRLVQGCNKWLRWAFVESSWVAIVCSPYFGGLYRHHRSRGKKANTAIMITARRMCQIAYNLLKEEREYRNTGLNNNLSGCSHVGRAECVA